MLDWDFKFLAILVLLALGFIYRR